MTSHFRPEPKLKDAGQVHVYKRTIVKAEKIKDAMKKLETRKQVEARQMRGFKIKSALKLNNDMTELLRQDLLIQQ